MKRKSFLLLVLLTAGANLYAQTAKNGDIIRTDTKTVEIKTTVKKCYDNYWLFLDNYDIYESCSFDKKIGKTKEFEYFEILELHLIEYIDKSSGKSSVLKGETWVKIRTQNLEGYLCKSLEEIIDPFLEFEKEYPIVEEFNTSKKFTARKLRWEEKFLFQDNAKLCDKPGKGSKVIYAFSSKDTTGDFVIATGLEITNEYEKIDESEWSDRWVKVRYKNLEGWIHGSYKETQAWFSGMDMYSPIRIIGTWFGDNR